MLTVSDGVAEGVREDKSGAALVARLEAAGATVVEHAVTADGVDEVAHALRTWRAASPGSSSPPAAPASGRATSRPKAPAR